MNKLAYCVARSIANLLAMVASVARSSLGPLFSKRVTGPLASDHVMVKGVPSVTVFQSVLVRITRARDREMAAEKAKRVAVENCILMVVVICVGVRMS